ncbi:hypothetical protein SEA_THERESITA_56 [Microbacterium phage Theresita]|nr:hypothetical protein SEA_THERESITA_56 [Microbacterium phage Theresita]
MTEGQTWRRRKRLRRGERGWRRGERAVPIYPDLVIIEEWVDLGLWRFSRYKVVKTGL